MNSGTVVLCLIWKVENETNCKINLYESDQVVYNNITKKCTSRLRLLFCKNSILPLHHRCAFNHRMQMWRSTLKARLSGCRLTDENIQKIIQKTIRVFYFDHFSIVKFECHKLVVIFKLRKSSNTSNTKLNIDFTCKVPPPLAFDAASQLCYKPGVLNIVWVMLNFMFSSSDR